jgi:hypothetical protein
MTNEQRVALSDTLRRVIVGIDIHLYLRAFLILDHFDHSRANTPVTSLV